MIKCKKSQDIKKENQALQNDAMAREIIDIFAWENRFKDKVLAYRLLQALLKEIIKVKTELKAAVDQNAVKEIQRIVEKFHANLLFCHVPQLKKMTGKFCALLRAKRRQEIPELYATLLAEMDKVEELGSAFLNAWHSTNFNVHNK